MELNRSSSVRLYSSRCKTRVVDVNIQVRHITYFFQIGFQDQKDGLYNLEFRKESIKDILGFIRELTNSLASRHYSFPQNFVYVRKDEKSST